ncbi:sorting nexin-10B isoform X2 [Stigmatopora argus]
MQPVISVWVRDPRIQKNDFWHAYMDYEVCLHTDSVFFNKKISRVRRRFREFVWLRQRLQANSMLMAQVPQLPPKNPFFSLNNAQQISERMAGLQSFLEHCLHLFLQTELSMTKMEACAAGKTRYSVVEAVQGCGVRRFQSLEDLQKDATTYGDSDSDSSESLNKVASDLMGIEQEPNVCCSSASL